jgi:Zn-dependent peptidase ImmA (M78 family)
MKEIDGFAELILSDFNASVLEEPAPVDIEALLEFYLGLSLDYQDLSHNRSILGMTVFNDCHIPVYNAANNTAKIIPVSEKTVLIDNGLLEDDQGPRYRFTLGHEAGHWILHRHKYLENKQQTSLFKAEEVQPLIKCRSADIENSSRRTALTTDNEWMEWQADYMASALLMPKPAFHIAVQGLLKQVGIHEGYITRGMSGEGDMFIQAIPFELADIFQVSVQAARIRCDKLGIVRDKVERQKMLF